MLRYFVNTTRFNVDALATLAATASFAQSSVTIYGQADAAYTSVKSGSNSFTGIQGAGRGSNFFGAMGTEDLGGGWKANFKLEAQYDLSTGAGSASNTNNQVNGGLVTLNGTAATTANSSNLTTTGTDGVRASLGGTQGLTFNRWAYAGLSNANVGEIRVGREYTPTFAAVLGADTTGANGVQNTLFQTLYLAQANSHANATSASNGVSYESPLMAGLRVKAQVFYGENVTPLNTNFNNGKSGDGTSYHISYANGPLTAGFGSQKTKGTGVAATSTTVGSNVPGDYQVDAAYAKYDLGVVLLTAGQVTEKLDRVTTSSASNGANKNVSNILGFSYPVAGTAVRVNGTYITSKYTVAGAETGKASQIGLQALYSMSKRTDLYVNYAVTDNSVGKTYGIGNSSSRMATVANNGDKSTAYQVGIRHNF